MKKPGKRVTWPAGLGVWARRRGVRARGLKPAATASATLLINGLRQSQSELEQQNQALRFSQAAAEGASERFVTLFSTVPLALMVVDADGLVLEINARALALFRPLETDPPLNFLYPLIQSVPPDQVRQGFVTATQQGTCELAELVFDGGSNGLFTGDLHIAHVDHATDEPSFICAIVDQSPLVAQRLALQTSALALTDRNSELLQSKNRLSAIIDSSLDAIVGVDHHQCIVVFNPSAAALFECPTDQAMGLPLAVFLPDVKRLLDDLTPVGHTQLGEVTGISLRGTHIPLDVSVSVEQQPSGRLATLFAHDLTVRKKLERHREALEAKLRESQKMQAIGTMAGGIAHDFNNIISAILGNVVLAGQDVGAQSAVAVSLAEIDKAGRRARDLVRQILTFSRNEQPKRVALQLADIVHETLLLVKVTLPPHIDLQATIDPATPPVLADATQIEQALLNLCTNAIHAIGPTAGNIRIDLSGPCAAPGTADNGGGQTGAWVRLRVTDTGCGMSMQTQQRVFEPFFTTKPVGQGTGLGLSVVHGIMASHQGHVDIQSTPGQGSVFDLYFLQAPVPVAVVPPPAPSVQPRGDGQRVMYVDDDEALVFLVKRVLTRQGYRVQTFTDPRAAVHALRADPACCDLLLTDFNMPGYSGVDLLQDAKTIRPDLPVALASGYVTPDIEQAARAAGACALIHKPNDVDELCRTVQAMLTAPRSQ